MKNKKGFTLVELIVVLAILAVLAGLLVPALTGYIDKAKKSKYMLDAKQCMTAFQTELVELYAQGVDPTSINNLNSKPKGKDISWLGTEQAGHILSLLDKKPYLLIMGTGLYEEYAKKAEDIYKSFTAYFVVYWPNKEEDPIFYNGTSWTNKYPWKGNNQNTFKVNGEDINMQFYIIEGPYPNNIDDDWNSLKCKIGERTNDCSKYNK